MPEHHFLFADPEILARYLKNIPGNTFTTRQVLCRFIDEMIMGDGNIESVRKHLKHSKNPVNTMILLEGVKCYLRSRDFNCPEKYERKKILFGLFTSVTETKKLDPIYEKIDNLIRDIKNKKEVKKSSPGRTSFRFHFNYKLIFVFLSFASASGATRFPRYNQSPNLPIDSSFVKAMKPCLPTDFIYEHYHVIANVPLEKARFFGIGDTHHIEAHQVNHVNVVNALGHVGDRVLMEGAGKGFGGECCYLPPLNTLAHKIRKGIMCEGWEDQKLYNEAIAKVNLLKAAAGIVDGGFESILKERDNLQRQVDDHKKLPEGVAKQFEAMRLSNEIKRYAERISAAHAVTNQARFLKEDGKVTRIRERNEHFIETINKTYVERPDSKRNKIFGYAGSRHFVSVPESVTDVTVEKDDPQQPLREWLENIPHAILIPK